jgi:hypothetical protein
MFGEPAGSLRSGGPAALFTNGNHYLPISIPDEGEFCIMSNVDVKNGIIDMTEEMGKACKLDPLRRSPPCKGGEAWPGR